MEKNSILIMCGGRGKRLGKAAESLPKPLMKIGDRTILEHKLKRYSDSGFRNFVVCLGYKGGMIKEALKGLDFSGTCVFSDAGEPAGILKRLYVARELFRDTVILTYGDTYSAIDLGDLSRAHEEGGNEATIVVAPIQNPFGIVEFDKENKVTSFTEKAVLNYYIGYAVINKSALGLVPSGVIGMPDGEGLVAFYKILAEKRKLGVYYHAGLQITFNTRDELEIARKKFSFYTMKEES